MNFTQIIEIPEISVEEYAEQLGVSVEEALVILEQNVAPDAHLDFALELE